MEAIEIVIWSPGQGEDLLDNDHPEVSRAKLFMKKVEESAEKINHRFCFWVLEDTPKPIAGTSNTIEEILKFSCDVCRACGVSGFSPRCMEDIAEQINELLYGLGPEEVRVIH